MVFDRPLKMGEAAFLAGRDCPTDFVAMKALAGRTWAKFPPRGEAQVEKLLRASSLRAIPAVLRGASKRLWSALPSPFPVGRG